MSKKALWSVLASCSKLHRLRSHSSRTFTVVSYLSSHICTDSKQAIPDVLVFTVMLTAFQMSLNQSGGNCGLLARRAQALSTVKLWGIGKAYAKLWQKSFSLPLAFKFSVRYGFVYCFIIEGAPAFMNKTFSKDFWDASTGFVCLKKLGWDLSQHSTFRSRSMSVTGPILNVPRVPMGILSHLWSLFRGLFQCPLQVSMSYR